ncbi:MAG TPA: hypothetical protein VK791_03820 [bacterium]|nr:hypothetical protein [bacterium]
MKKGLRLSWLIFILLFLGVPYAKADHEWITVPVVVTDYYGWAYTEAFMDNATVYGFSTAGVDALGWTLLIGAGDYDAGLKFVNLAGLTKTIYPVVTLLAASDTGTRERAWIALGTHTVTLVTLEFLGRPALTVEAFGPRHDAYGASLAFRF